MKTLCETEQLLEITIDDSILGLLTDISQTLNATFCGIISAYGPGY